MNTIIIPMYNAGRRIDACLQALGRQTSSKECELLVVDDGSTDGNGDRLRQEGHTVLTQKNQGPGSARNHGARNARGDILLFIDSDCVPREDWVAETLKPFSDPEVLSVACAYRSLQTGLIPRFCQLEFEERYRRMMQRDRVDVAGSHAVAFRRGTFLDTGGFSPELIMNEDVDLSYRIAELGGKIHFNPHAIVYHEHRDSVRAYCNTKLGRGYWRMIVYHRHPSKAFSDSYTPQNLKFQMLCAVLFLPAATLSLLGPRVAWPAVLLVALCTWTMVPFLAGALRQSLALAMVSYFMLWARAFSLSAGAVVGFLAGAVLRGGIKPRRSEP